MEKYANDIQYFVRRLYNETTEHTGKHMYNYINFYFIL